MFKPSFREIGSLVSSFRSKKDDDFLLSPEPAVTRAQSSSYELRHKQTVTPADEQSYLSQVAEESVIGGVVCNDDASNEDAENLYPKPGWQLYCVVLGSFLTCFTLFGLMNSIGAIESRIQEHELADVRVSSVSWIFSIYMFIALFMGIFVGPLYDSFGSTVLLSIGTVLTFAGLMGTASSKSLGSFIACFGLICGIGTGFLMTPTIAAVSSWAKPSIRPVCTGLGQAGGSLGGIIMPIMLRATYPISFEWAIRILAFVTLVVDIAGTFLCRDRRKELHRLSGNVDNRSLLEKLKHSIDLRGFKEKEYCALNVGFFFNEFALLIVLTFISTYATLHGFSQASSFNLLIIMNALGFLGKFIPSYMAGTYGCYNVMILMSGLISAVCWAIWLPLGKYKPALYVFVVLFGFAYAATYALTPALISTEMIFVNQNANRHPGRAKISFSTRYGTSYGAFVSFGNIIALPLAGAFIKEKTAAEYDHMVIFAASCSTAATLAFVGARYTLVGWSSRARI